MSEKDMSDFDWVTERDACSLASAYEKLRFQIQQDIDIRKALRPTNEQRFSMEGGSKGFAVIRQDFFPNTHETVIFALTDKAIEIRDTNQTLFEVTTTLNKDGKCRLRIAGQECDFWQVRMMALEHLFFGSR